MSKRHDVSKRDRQARLRFSIIGALLAAPSAKGELLDALRALAAKPWRDPCSGLDVRFGVSTLERWYYTARRARDPVAALTTRLRAHAGCFPSLSAQAQAALVTQYREHPGWTIQLHYDNLLVALAGPDATQAVLPSYATLRRFCKARGMVRQRAPRRATDGALAARERLEHLEVRSFEMDHVGALWHLDFHHGSRRVLTAKGEWVKPFLMCIMDDRSRLVCHLQWYLDESAHSLVHALSQALMKRGLPRALMTDNGAAMLAAETTSGLARLGIVHQPTLPYSPYQNAKQEVFWARIESRLIAMLEGQAQLGLDLLNQATQAWVEQEYHRSIHSEFDATPLARYLAGPSVSRPAPGSDALREAFRIQARRRLRRSDGTVSLEGRRFEIPNRYRHLQDVHLRYARWDLSHVDLVERAQRRFAVRRASAGQVGQRRWPASAAGPPGTRSVAACAHRHGAVAAPAAGRARRHGLATSVLAHPASHAYAHTHQGPLMNQKLLALYGLKWNPFTPEVPVEALHVSARLESFCWRIEHAQAREGGFALIHGEPGSGKSVALRVLAQRLARLPDVQLATLSHPQCNLADFYRELGDVFAVPLRPHNRWGGFKALRERWLAHLESCRRRPVLLIDEAQEMSVAVLSELRLMASAQFDSQPLLCVVLAGDARLLEKFKREELIPLGSRIRTRLATEAATPEELRVCLEFVLGACGNANLMSTALKHTLCEHAAGNYRVLTTLASELLSAAAERELPQLDEQLYFQVFALPVPKGKRIAAAR